MLSKLLYDIQELPPDHRVVAGQRHRRLLYYVAHLASWTSNLYLVLRLALCFSAVQQNWRAWLTLLVETVLASMSIPP